MYTPGIREKNIEGPLGNNQVRIITNFEFYRYCLLVRVIGNYIYTPDRLVPDAFSLDADTMVWMGGDVHGIQDNGS